MFLVRRVEFHCPEPDAVVLAKLKARVGRPPCMWPATGLMWPTTEPSRLVGWVSKSCVFISVWRPGSWRSPAHFEGSIRSTPDGVTHLRGYVRRIHPVALIAGPVFILGISSLFSWSGGAPLAVLLGVALLALGFLGTDRDVAYISAELQRVLGPA